MELILAVIGGFLALFGVVIYQRKQIGIDKGILSTLPFQNKENEISKDISLAQGLLEAEQKKREDLTSTASKEEKKDASKEELLDFFNNLNNPNK